MRAALVRARGQVTGFLTDDFGLIETTDCPWDEEGRQQPETYAMVVFHVRDLYLFGRPWHEQRRHGGRRCPTVQVRKKGHFGARQDDWLSVIYISRRPFPPACECVSTHVPCPVSAG